MEVTPNAYSAVNVSIGRYLLKIVNVEVTPNVYSAVNVSIAKYLLKIINVEVNSNNFIICSYISFYCCFEI